jgi:hypothetical protein
MRVETYSEPGSPRKRNEDWVGHSGRSVVVLDGLSAPEGLGSSCKHDVPWFVNELGNYLLAICESAESGLEDLLAHAISHVAGLHSETCDLSSPDIPSSTVAILRASKECVEWLILADSAILLDCEVGEVEVVTDAKVENSAKLEKEAALAVPVGSPLHEERVRELVAAQRLVRNTPEGYWVASASPDAARYATTGSIEIDRVKRAALMTDGAAKLVEFGIDTWDETFARLADGGPQALVAQVRIAEKSDPSGVKWPRYKAQDDATVAYLVFP